MNSYGEPESARGRARFPGLNRDHGPEADYAYRRSGDAGSSGRAQVGHAPAGRAQVGRAQAGRAGVPRPVSPGPADGYDRPAGRASVGRGAVGAASVGGAGASGAAPVSGRATVGRAVVRPVSPGTPGAGGPGGPGGPRGRRGGKDDPAAQRRAKRRKRLNLMIASFAVFIMLAGVGVVGFTWYYDAVQAPTDFGEPQATTITYAEGTQLAKLGVNRTIVPHEKISEVVKHAVVAAEDKGFYDHGGIDVKGIARAAWNNFTGGDKQGASTITQQYARHIADMNEISYQRKIREAMLASKLEKEKSKDEILGYYLNAVYFGRGAYGIEAAAHAYFGKSVLTPPGEKNALTIEEAAVLAAVIKQPEASATHKGYDPQLNLPAAQDRWNYTLKNMVEKGWMAEEARAAAKYPAKTPENPQGTLKTWDPKTACASDCGINTPQGNVINYVSAELKAMGIDWKKGGYRITTTIRKPAQEAAVKAAQKTNKASPMYELSKKYRGYMAALVAIDPTNGRVIAYYGGDKGVGTDYAGLNADPNTGALFGGHQPGSTFKIYTLAAALEANISMQSHWDSTKTKDGDRPEISNAGRKAQCAKWCVLEEMTIQSYNVPFYWITKELGPDKVVDAAKRAGIRTMWPDSEPAVDLTTVDPKKVAPSKFDTYVGFGQYRVTVLDHANGMATIANRGVYNKAHFVEKVEQRDASGKWIKAGGEKREPKEVFEKAKMDNLNGVLQKIPGANGNALAGGRPASGKTGTWQYGNTGDNAHAWMIGATPQIASAVWVGREGNDGAIKELNGKNMSGGGTPAEIWEQFMEDAHKALKLPEKSFAERKNTGDPDHPMANGVSPTPSPPPGPPCLDPTGLFCPQNGNGGNNGGGDRNPFEPGGGGGLLPSPSPTIRLRG